MERSAPNTTSGSHARSGLLGNESSDTSSTYTTYTMTSRRVTQPRLSPIDRNTSKYKLTRFPPAVQQRTAEMRAMSEV
eukprot:scaffold380418_cov31-Prasinocladus_malaysianus.AAC.2